MSRHQMMNDPRIVLGDGKMLDKLIPQVTGGREVSRDSLKLHIAESDDLINA